MPAWYIIKLSLMHKKKSFRAPPTFSNHDGSSSSTFDLNLRRLKGSVASAKLRENPQLNVVFEFSTIILKSSIVPSMEGVTVTFINKIFIMESQSNFDYTSPANSSCRKKVAWNENMDELLFFGEMFCENTALVSFNGLRTYNLPSSLPKVSYHSCSHGCIDYNVHGLLLHLLLHS